MGKPRENIENPAKSVVSCSCWGSGSHGGAPRGHLVLDLLLRGGDLESARPPQSIQKTSLRMICMFFPCDVPCFPLFSCLSSSSFADLRPKTPRKPMNSASPSTRSTRVHTGFLIYTGMTLGISKLLQPDSVDLTDADKRRLLGLQRRVQCMVQPLNFLLLWSKSRDDRVQQVVLTAQELLSLGSFGLAQTWRLFGGFRAEKRRRGLVRRRFPSFSLGFRRKM